MHGNFFREASFQNETYNSNLQNITSATAGMVCEILRLAFLSRSNENILVKVLEHEPYDDSVWKKNSRCGSVSFDP